MFDQQMAAIFARQHGLITRADAVAAGATPEMIESRRRSGRWVRVAPGVYRLAGVPVTWRQRALAACLDAGPGAVVSHRSAAVLYGVSGFRPGPIDITVPRGRSGRNALAHVHRSEVAQQAKRHGIPLTKVNRTVADVARVVSPDLLAEAVDDVLCRRLVRLEQLEGGPAKLRRILEAWNGEGALAASVAEMQLVRDLLAAGLPQPVRQYWIAEAHARVDLALPDYRLAIEMDSFRWHAGRRPFDADRSRGNRIVAAGWQLLRATPADTASAVTAAAQLLRRVA